MKRRVFFIPSVHSSRAIRANHRRGYFGMILDLRRRYRSRYFQARNYIAAFPVSPPRPTWPTRLALSMNKCICFVPTIFYLRHLNRFARRLCSRSFSIQKRVKLSSTLDILSSFSFIHREHWATLQSIVHVCKTLNLQKKKNGPLFWQSSPFQNGIMKCNDDSIHMKRNIFLHYFRLNINHARQ